MSVITGLTKPILFPYLNVSLNVYSISVDLGIIRAAITAPATWTLPNMSLLKHGAFLWIDNQTSFTITVVPSGSDVINGDTSFIISNGNFATLFTGSEWNATSSPIPPSGTSTNTNYGLQTLASITTGIDDSAFGYQSMQFTTTGSDNTSVGYRSLRNNITGDNNSAFGDDALVLNTTGTDNVAVGENCLAANTTGNGNTAIGKAALQSNTTANDNVAVGTSSLNSNTTGADNVAIGPAALYGNTIGSSNIAIGINSLSSCVDGGNNISIGTGTLGGLTNGSGVIAIGDGALSTANGDNNICVGTSCGAFLSGNTCTAFGYQALQQSTVNNLCAFGDNALKVSTSGTFNCAFGSSALIANSTGNNNSVFGSGSGVNLTTGSGNTFVGEASGLGSITGSNNTCVGLSANVNGAALTNSTCLGNNATATSSNTMVFGNGTVGSSLNNTFTGPITTIGKQNAVTNFIASGTILTANLSTGIITATGAGGYTLTLDSTSNIIAGIFPGNTPLGSIFKLGVSNGSTGSITINSGDGSTTFSLGIPVMTAGTAVNPTFRILYLRLSASGAIVIS
jgi:hypothetical protein